MSKEKEVEAYLKEQFFIIKECLELFAEATKDYINDGKDYEKISYQCHKKEHEADILCRKIQVKISEGAFLPFYREDFIELSESIDVIANIAKTCAQDIVLEKPKLPENIKEGLKKLADDVLNCYLNLITVLDNFFVSNRNKIMILVEEISNLEQETDSLQWKLVTSVFQNDNLELAEKIQLKSIIQNISEVADAIEDVSDKVLVMITKLNL